MSEYVPEAGDIVWLQFDPQAGHEQRGKRPALVLSPSAYNGIVGLMLCCPLTTKVKNYPFEVSISGIRKNVALSDQVKSLDWRVRQAKFKARATAEELQTVRDNLLLLLG